MTYLAYDIEPRPYLRNATSNTGGGCDGMMIDPKNSWLFYVEGGKRKFRGRWYLLIAGMLYVASSVIVYRGGF